ncbi:putative BSD domain-containing protein [Tanacetum coccineum]
MSWLARSISNNLIINDDDQPTTSNNLKSADIINQEEEFDDQDSHNLRDGVKGDLSEFTESLAKQIWGVASFLAPPPPPPPLPPLPQPDRNSEKEDDECEVSNSVREDLVEEKEKEIVGVTEEVLGFATNIAHHPETWLDFPLSEDEDSDGVSVVSLGIPAISVPVSSDYLEPNVTADFDYSERNALRLLELMGGKLLWMISLRFMKLYFEMSDTQWNHATLVEHLVPRLAALRIEFCPIHMSESYFWKVYFVLLHPRLNKHDADLLSTPQIVAARTMWMKELHMQTKPEPEYFEGNTPRTVDSREDNNTTSSDSPSANMSERKQHAFEPTTYYTVTETRPPVLAKEEVSRNGASDQRVIPSYTKPIEDFNDDEDNWIHDNSEELDGYEGPHVPVGTDEDISFNADSLTADLRPALPAKQDDSVRKSRFLKPMHPSENKKKSMGKVDANGGLVSELDIIKLLIDRWLEHRPMTPVDGCPIVFQMYSITVFSVFKVRRSATSEAKKEEIRKPELEILNSTNTSLNEAEKIAVVTTVTTADANDQMG